MNERNTHTNKKWWMAICGILLFVAIGILPAAASVLPGYQNINITPANGIRFNNYNDGTYFFKLGSGGLNALHITNDPINAVNGQVTKTQNLNGTFWITDTGGRGFDDDAILLIAVNGTIDPGLRINITSSGYNWTPTGVKNQIPELGAVDYHASAVNNVPFGPSDFIYDNDASEDIMQTWKPSTSMNYPIFSGEDVTNEEMHDFRLIPVDLKVGILGTGTNSTYYTSLTDYGAARVDYSITGLGTSNVIAFNAYAYTNQSNQGQGVSWTNAVNKSTDGPGSSYSGWLVTR